MLIVMYLPQVHGDVFVSQVRDITCRRVQLDPAVVGVIVIGQSVTIKVTPSEAEGHSVTGGHT